MHSNYYHLIDYTFINQVCGSDLAELCDKVTFVWKQLMMYMLCYAML